MSSEYKTYRWNRNAATHKDALTRFSWIASLLAGMAGVMVGIAFLPVERTAQTYKSASIVFLVATLLTWLLVFGALTWAYWALNEVTYKVEPAPPTPPKEPKVTRVWANGKLAYSDIEEGE